MVTQRYRFRVGYLGTNFVGWQFQPNERTVQNELQNAFRAIGEPVSSVIGAGRTDSGVHATGQVAHVDLVRDWNRIKLERAVNSQLPDDIRIYDAELATADFHARFKASGRCYIYRISLIEDPLRHDTELYWEYPVDRELVDSACKAIVGSHDFSAFIQTGSNNSPICNVHQANWEWETNYRFRFKIYADRFGWKMVRRLVGVMLTIGRKKFPVDFIDELLRTGIEPKWCQVVPAQGLIFAGVTYPEVFGGPEQPDPVWFDRTNW